MEVTFESDSGAATRLCESCLEVRPLGEFRRRKQRSESRGRECRQCHNGRERQRRTAARAGQNRRRLARGLAEVRDAASAERVRIVCAAMIRAYGGTEGLVKAWTACLHRDLARGGMAAIRHLEATIRLVQHCEQRGPDYRSMSDEELLDLASRMS